MNRSTYHVSADLCQFHLLHNVFSALGKFLQSVDDVIQQILCLGLKLYFLWCKLIPVGHTYKDMQCLLDILAYSVQYVVFTILCVFICLPLCRTISGSGSNHADNIGLRWGRCALDRGSVSEMAHVPGSFLLVPNRP